MLKNLHYTASLDSFTYFDDINSKENQSYGEEIILVQ